jgi:hypothetical protein
MLAAVWGAPRRTVLAGLYVAVLLCLAVQLVRRVYRTARRAAAAGPPQESGRFAPEWRRLRRRYDDPEFASWVMAQVLTSDIDQVFEFAAAWHDRWKQAQDPRFDRERRARHEAAHAVVAHAMGCTVLAATVEPGPANEGRVQFVLPIPRLPAHDSAWVSMVSVLAGRVVDHERGAFDEGSTQDVWQASHDAAVIISAGRAPRGYQGKLSTDGLLAAAGELCGQIVQHNWLVIDMLAVRLLISHPGTVSGPDLRQLLHDTWTLWPREVEGPGPGSAAERDWGTPSIAEEWL